MKILFFSARKIQFDYFNLLSMALSSRGYQSHVISHKSLRSSCAWIFYLSKKPSDIQDIVSACINEKKNARKHRGHSQIYWRCFRLLKTIETHYLFSLYYSLLKDSSPDALILWNGLKYRQSILACCAKYLGIRCLYMENGLIPNMTTIDNQGINFLNSIPRSAEFFLQAPLAHHQLKAMDDTPKPKSLPQRYIFVPFQVNTDTQVTRFSPWIKNTEDLVDIFIEASQRLKESMPQIIFKTHPKGDEDLDQIKNRIRHVDKLSIVDNISTLTLIQYADAVMTINSTVGIEALMAHKKVIVLGDAFYQIEGLTLSAKNLTDLTSTLQSYSSWPLNERLIDNFLSYLKNNYQIAGSWKKPTKIHIDKMCDRIITLSKPATA